MPTNNLQLKLLRLKLDAAKEELTESVKQWNEADIKYQKALKAYEEELQKEAQQNKKEN